ncbi:MAG: exostosin family protein [bacterium]|nr:exostosin family protein [bacterium]
MTNVYIEQQGLPELTPSLVFWPNYRFPIKESRLFLRDIMAQYSEPFFNLVDRKEEADFFAVPFEYFDVVDGFGSYLARVYASAKEAGKKVLLFDYTDYVDRVPTLPKHAVLFRVSAYRHHKKENEFVMPYFVQDFGSLPFSTKSPEPVIGFCGLSGYGRFPQSIKAEVKWYMTAVTLFLQGDRLRAVHRKGIYWRKQSLSVLRQTAGIKPAFVERHAYSLHRDSVEGTPERIRAEYTENLRASHLALVVRGDANASQRFYEALSAGRIPLFLDTNCVLPLEELVPYDSGMLRVPWTGLRTLGEVASKRYTMLTDTAFMEMERSARRIFQGYLKLDRYFAIVFDKVHSPYRNVLYGATHHE